MDGIESNHIAVNESDLIQRLNMSLLFSPTYGDVRHDLSLAPYNYKGMHISSRRRNQSNLDSDQHWFQMRGSLIKVANNGLHNCDPKDPIQLLYALDDLITNVRLDPFKTPLNGFELSATVRLTDAEQICSGIVSYLNIPPSHKTIHRDSLDLPYVEIEAKQHKLKLYAPQPDTLRIEVKIDKMQFLGADRPRTLADLVQPRFTALLVSKLLSALDKIIWKYSPTDVSRLTQEESQLYLLGRVSEYWQVIRRNFTTESEFKRVEKQRSRERKRYNELVRRLWQGESPETVRQRTYVQLKRYEEIMRTPLYQTLLNICYQRWRYVGNLPGVVRLPKHLKLPDLSEIYPLYLGKFPTPSESPYCYIGQPGSSVDQTANLFSENTPLFQVNEVIDPARMCLRSLKQTQLNKFPKSQARCGFTNYSTHVKKVLNSPGGLNYPLDEVERILSATTKISLAYASQSLNNLRIITYSSLNALPLFSAA